MAKRIALVVGGASGIGLAIAERLANDGARVFLTGRNADAVTAAAPKVGEGAQAIVADASDPGDITRIVEIVRTEAGQIDQLVLNAGMGEPSLLADTTPEHIDRHFAVNVRAAVLSMRAAVAMMPAGGAVLLVGSVAAAKGSPLYATYGATKAALHAYGRTWAAEHAPRGIRVNIVSPGPTDTAMFAAVDNQIRAALVGQIPLGRMGRTTDVAAAASFLLGDEAGFVTGADLAVDGGMLLS